MNHFSLNPAIDGAMATRIFEACEKFEEDLRNGKCPILQDYLAGFTGLARQECEAALKHALMLFSQASTADPVPEQQAVGKLIGPYKLLQKLDEGGMGTVFLAEQQEPVQRRVALKVIKAGLDSAQVIARFEQERQALAMMDHPNIAKVLDAGTTDGGSPYVVMELVKGIPITDYCDQEHLTPRQRLELFIPVCQAVQHAHQKGIIHRDLKPANVLVAHYDGKPVPKVIDFGVAKATGAKLTQRTMFTEVGQMVGTLEYMAPEQAELNNLDIDTRADIYSLGVLLYELLAGSPPFTSQKLRSAAFTEMLRIIREVDPPKPSTKLSNSAELPNIAAIPGLWFSLRIPLIFGLAFRKGFCQICFLVSLSYHSGKRNCQPWLSRPGRPASIFPRMRSSIAFVLDWAKSPTSARGKSPSHWAMP